jgi:hypothetical protein
LAKPGKMSWLSAISPFRIWFWFLLAVGLTVTRQLSRRMAIAVCTLFCVAAMGARAAMSMAGS